MRYHLLGIEIVMDPKAVRDGHDPQLELALAVALEQPKQHSVLQRTRPAYPNYQHTVGTGAAASRGGNRQ